MSHSNITPNITDSNSRGKYDCISCGAKKTIPEASLYPWQYFADPAKFRIQGTCTICGSSTTLWHEDASGNEIIAE